MNGPDGRARRASYLKAIRWTDEAGNWDVSFAVDQCMALADSEVAAASVELQKEVDRLSAECDELRGTVLECRRDQQAGTTLPRCPACGPMADGSPCCRPAPGNVAGYDSAHVAEWLYAEALADYEAAYESVVSSDVPSSYRAFTTAMHAALARAVSASGGGGRLREDIEALCNDAEIGKVRLGVAPHWISTDLLRAALAGEVNPE